MSSYSSPPLRVELGHVEQLETRRPGTRWPKRAANEGLARHRSPFAALAQRLGRPMRVAILSDFIRIPYANGAAFQTRFLYQELRRSGHEVTIIGPSDPEATPD